MTTTPPIRTAKPIRTLTPEELGLSVPEEFDLPSFDDEIEEPLISSIADDDPVLNRTRELLADGFAGVILFGPPGTSKTWYAREISAKLVEGDPRRVRFIQFHPSYQYEDFVEAYVPNENGGFELTNKHLLLLSKAAKEQFPDQLCVLVIDELSRCDVARVFGETLTYIERTRRGQPFRLASGRTASIPENIAIIGTMNPWDKGVDEIDAALERRFARIALEPNLDRLKGMLATNEVEGVLAEKIHTFFSSLLKHKNPFARIGHAYFRSVSDRASLVRLWEHQLHFHFERAFRLDPDALREVEQAWARVVAETPPVEAAPNTTPT